VLRGDADDLAERRLERAGGRPHRVRLPADRLDARVVEVLVLTRSRSASTSAIGA
jgi:hypothetical protein